MAKKETETPTFEHSVAVLRFNAANRESQIRISERALADVDAKIADDKAKGKPVSPDLAKTRGRAEENLNRQRAHRDDYTAAAAALEAAVPAPPVQPPGVILPDTPAAGGRA